MLWVSKPPRASARSECEHALEIFVDIYGAEAGNLALKVLREGGHLSGGYRTEKILPACH